MDYKECLIGNTEIFLPISNRLLKIMAKTNGKINYSKYVSKKHHSPCNTIVDEMIVLSPIFIFALEDTLSELGNHNILHNTILEFPIENQRILNLLLREGKSFRFLALNHDIAFEESLYALQSLFEKLSSKIL